MSFMRKENEKVIAIFCADIHLSFKAPVWRSAEPDWFLAMARPLLELSTLQQKYECPVICAGDILDRWNSPPELINFAIEHLPNDMYAVPGQHDLPLHKYEDIKRSAYWTLVEAGKIKHIPPGNLLNIAGSELTLYGYPYGKKINAITTQSEFFQIAVVHEYRCIKGKSFSQAPSESYLYKNEKNLIGYDIIVYGDNHKGFLTKVNNNSTIFNCGTLMRRKSDEINYKPQIGLLFESRKVEPYYLNISEDKHLDIQNSLEKKDSLDIKTFIKELEKLDASDLDFRETVIRYLLKKKINKPVCEVIYKAMGIQNE